MNKAQSIKDNLLGSGLEGLLLNFISYKNMDVLEVNEQPVALIVFTQDGSQIYAVNISEEIQFNSYLVSSFLSAVNSFGSQVFGHGIGGLEKITHEDFHLLLRKKNQRLYCYIYKGESNMSGIRINSIIEEIHEIVDSIGEIVMVEDNTIEMLDDKVGSILNFKVQSTFA